MATFTNFKNDFYARLTDLSLFDCEEINLIKVVLDGLKVNYVNKGKVRPFLFYPKIIYNLFCFLKLQNRKVEHRELKLKLSNQKNKEIIISDIGRIIFDENENPRSLYFDGICKLLGRSNTCIILDRLINEKLDFDLNLKDFEKTFAFSKLTKEEDKFRTNLLETFKKIKKSNIFTKTEIQNIKFAIHKFFHDYKVWNNIISYFPNLKKTYFICHYHKEGQIYAFKKRNIPCIELQHGLIAHQDIFYVFPEKIKNYANKALFADKILVYGKYWKDILLNGYEYADSQIDILGYYLFNNFELNYKLRDELDNLISDKKVILITTQTFLHKYFIDFTFLLLKNLNKKYDNVLIVIKPHPSENSKIYLDVFENNNMIKVVNYPTPLLFEYINIHISIYSTTLYDALRYNVINYVFRVEECDDYIDAILNDEIAEEISASDDLFVKDQKLKKLDNTLFFDKLNPSVIL